MELKFNKLVKEGQLSEGSNCTFMELKFNYKMWQEQKQYEF